MNRDAGGSILDFSYLEQNIFDVIKEEQIKLGYRKESIRLFYPLLSLNRLLKSDFQIDEMKDCLITFCRLEEDKLGKTEISNQGERFCFHFSPEASEYIHSNKEQDGFLRDFIQTVSGHHVSIDEVLEQFHKYSDHVHFEKAKHGEFDYLIYFEDGHPDSYRYCLTDEGCHMIYHRFTIDDYNDFCF
jgi:hypothetical protein